MKRSCFPGALVRLGWVAGGLALCVLGCDAKPATATPDDSVALGRVEPTPKPKARQATKQDPAAKPQEAGTKAKDRDPEEEKRKMAKSRQRSSQARKMLVSGRHAEAVANARAALKIHEQNVDAMMVLAEVFYRQNKNELVVSVTGTALGVDEKARTPRDTSTAYNLQGFALAALGKDQMATTAFKKAAEADDKNAAAWNNLGTRYLRAGDVNTSASCFEYAIELRPTFAKAHLNYGAALRAQGKLIDAEKELLKSLKLRKGYAEAYFNLGVLYLDADPFPELETVARLNKAISNLNKYKQLTSGVSTEPSPTGLGSRKRMPAVSKDRADDYIRVAEKGLKRESRLTEREGKRKADAEKEANEAAAAAAAASATPQKPGAGAEPATGAAGVSKPGTASPSKPGTAKPGTAKPGTVSPSKPSAKPTKPASPSKPSAKPTKPAKPSAKPTKPSAKPTKPSAKPAKPSAKPAKPTKPSAKPTKPSAKPNKPGGAAKPGTTPQKPQRPGQKSAAAWNPRGRDDSNYRRTAVLSPGCDDLASYDAGGPVVSVTPASLALARPRMLKELT